MYNYHRRSEDRGEGLDSGGIAEAELTESGDQQNVREEEPPERGGLGEDSGVCDAGHWVGGSAIHGNCGNWMCAFELQWRLVGYFFKKYQQVREAGRQWGCGHGSAGGM